MNPQLVYIMGNPIPHKQRRFSFHSKTCYIENGFREQMEVISNAIRQMLADVVMIDGPASVFYMFGIKIPESWPEKKKALARLGTMPCCTKPDEGNYTYFLDNRIEGTAITNDSRICSKIVRKFYCTYPVTLLCVWRYGDIDERYILERGHAFFEEMSMSDSAPLLGVGSVDIKNIKVKS